MHPTPNDPTRTTEDSKKNDKITPFDQTTVFANASATEKAAWHAAGMKAIAAGSVCLYEYFVTV